MKRQLHLFFSYIFYLLCFQQIQAQAYFQNQAAIAGVDDYADTIYLGSGIFFCDCTNDELQDIYLTNDTVNTTNILYRNNNNRTFQTINRVQGTSPVNTEEFQKRNKIIIYTNPITGQIWTQIDSGETYKYILFDSIRVAVKNGKIASQDFIDISSLASG
ncbi:MAG: hypothetical protein AAF611_06985 [Bacteroidota bacterium]